jgi:signal transduction histidine kinase
MMASQPTTHVRQRAHLTGCAWRDRSRDLPCRRLVSSWLKGAEVRGKARSTILSETVTAPFRARARILALLGDQLIGSDQLAIFELVKNAYDADATFAIVHLRKVDSDDPSISVRDDGDGMTLETLKTIWLEPASDHREAQRLRNDRTKKFHRLPLGEKGVGRFAVHKLGLTIHLTTRPRDSAVEHEVIIDWEALTKVKYLDETKIQITTRKPQYFLEEKGRSDHGTHIVIGRLRKLHWRRGEARQLFRSITAISSPFGTSEGFKAKLHIPDHPEWISEMPDVKVLLDMAPWRYNFSFDGTLTWDYEFRSPAPKRLQGRKLSKNGDKLLLVRDASSRETPVADEKIIAGIGPIHGSFVAYDRDRKVLALLTQTTLVKEFLDQQGGVRVYRDGIRVHNYGEPGDDWLHLDIRRVQRPGERLSRNIVIGAINLKLGPSSGLREKTNREGFDETEVYERFQRIVTSIVHAFEVERAIDKDRLKRTLDGGGSTAVSVPVEAPLKSLREAVNANAGAPVLLPLIDRVEREYQEMRDLLLRAGLSGLNLGMVIHEVERGIRSLYEAARSGATAQFLETQSRELMGLIESVGGLLRDKSRGEIDLRKLVQDAAEICMRRFKRHQVNVTYDLPENIPAVRGSSTLLQNVLVNLIDNAIYWMDVRWPSHPAGDADVRRLRIALTEDLPGGPALVIADNGPGFQDLPEVITKPFFTRRPDGIGLGLYYASLAMTLSGGSLLFPEHDDIELPEGLDGAVVAMSFANVKP